MESCGKAEAYCLHGAAVSQQATQHSVMCWLVEQVQQVEHAAAFKLGSGRQGSDCCTDGARQVNRQSSPLVGVLARNAYAVVVICFSLSAEGDRHGMST